MTPLSGPDKQASSIDSASAGFPARNAELLEIHGDVLTHEVQIRDAIETALKSEVPLDQLLGQLRRQGLLPFLTGSRIEPDFRLYIRMADDLSTLSYFRIDSDLTAEQLNGAVCSEDLRLKLLAAIPNPVLMFSFRNLQQNASPGEAEMAAQLFMSGRRITDYGGVLVTWDQSVDQNVWTTNIDTVNFIHALSRDGFFERGDIRSLMEIGTGGGHITKTAVARFPRAEEFIATDISPYALMCAKRNIRPALREGQKLHLYLGKGIKTINAAVDALLVNPPYLPTLLPPDMEDPYRGTGLIKEIVELGLQRLNPRNPRACIYLGMSSLAERDLKLFLRASPALKAVQIGERRQVPLKILKVNENAGWMDFLVREHGLLASTQRLEQTGHEFWHEIYVLRLNA